MSYTSVNGSASSGNSSDVLRRSVYVFMEGGKDKSPLPCVLLNLSIGRGERLRASIWYLKLSGTGARFKDALPLTKVLATQASPIHRESSVQPSAEVEGAEMGVKFEGVGITEVVEEIRERAEEFKVEGLGQKYVNPLSGGTGAGGWLIGWAHT